MIFQALATLGLSAVLILARVYNDYTHTKAKLHQIHVPTTFLPNDSIFSNTFGSSSYKLVLGQFQFWLKKLELYKDGWNVSAAVSLWPNVRTTLLIGDPTIFKEVCTNRTLFPKPIEQYTVLGFFGRNILVTEGNEWKMYRKICSPAFSERNNRLVWDESIKCILELFNEVWGSEREIVVDDFSSCALELGLHIISIAGFGKHLSWTHPDRPSSSSHFTSHNHQMTLEEIFQVISKDLFLKVAIPDWFPGLIKRLRVVRMAFEDLMLYLQEMIHERRSSNIINEKSDLFSNLLAANQDEVDEDSKMDDSQLIGNIFIFLLAGHETTSHTIAFAMGLLALYPDEQEKLWEEIQSVCPDRVPTYEDMPSLTRATAIFNETLRLFPSVIGIPKCTSEDTSFTLTNSITGNKLTIPVPKGTQIVLHPPAMHYNPKYWPDPHEFNPGRFLGDWPRDAFAPFSSGARSCIGKRFAEIEGAAIISMLVKHYRVSVLDDPKFQNETFEEKKGRVLGAVFGMTLTPTRVPLVFTRRE